jgi:hypothetical protein
MNRMKSILQICDIRLEIQMTLCLIVQTDHLTKKPNLPLRAQENMNNF